MKKIGKEVLFLEAKGNIPRNGEGSFIRLNDGRIMFGYTEFSGNDWPDEHQGKMRGDTPGCGGWCPGD